MLNNKLLRLVSHTAMKCRRRFSEYKNISHFVITESAMCNEVFSNYISLSASEIV